MAWIQDGRQAPPGAWAEEHRGWVAHELLDGRLAASPDLQRLMREGRLELAEGSVDDGILVRRPRRDEDRGARAAQARKGKPTPAETYEVVPWDQLAGWRARCVCGWAGRQLDRPRTITGESGGRDPEDTFLTPDLSVEFVARNQWDMHVLAVEHHLTAAVRAAAQQAEAAQQALEAAVAAARAATPRATWAQIGQATGMSRQSAHERWKRLDQSGTPAEADEAQEGTA